MKITVEKKQWIHQRTSGSRSGSNLKKGYQLTKKAIESGNLPDAFLYASDELALGGYRAFSESGIQVGKDISIVSIDNLPYASYLTRPSQPWL